MESLAEGIAGGIAGGISGREAEEGVVSSREEEGRRMREKKRSGYIELRETRTHIGSSFI